MVNRNGSQIINFQMVTLKNCLSGEHCKNYDKCYSYDLCYWIQLHGLALFQFSCFAIINAEDLFSTWWHEVAHLFVCVMAQRLERGRDSPGLQGVPPQTDLTLTLLVFCPTKKINTWVSPQFYKLFELYMYHFNHVACFWSGGCKKVYCFYCTLYNFTYVKHKLSEQICSLTVIIYWYFVKYIINHNNKCFYIHTHS